jgi:hypothetical protein
MSEERETITWGKNVYARDTLSDEQIQKANEISALGQMAQTLQNIGVVLQNLNSLGQLAAMGLEVQKAAVEKTFPQPIGNTDDQTPPAAAVPLPSGGAVPADAAPDSPSGEAQSAAPSEDQGVH